MNWISYLDLPVRMVSNPCELQTFCRNISGTDITVQVCRTVPEAMWVNTHTSLYRVYYNDTQLVMLSTAYHEVGHLRMNNEVIYEGDHNRWETECEVVADKWALTEAMNRDDKQSLRELVWFKYYNDSPDLQRDYPNHTRARDIILKTDLYNHAIDYLNIDRRELEVNRNRFLTFLEEYI